MGPYLIEIMATIYLSGFLLVFIPVLGVIIGTIAGGLARGVGTVFGLFIGFASGASGLALAFVVARVLREIFGIRERVWTGLLVSVGLPLSGAFAPIVVIPLVGLRRRARQEQEERVS